MQYMRNLFARTWLNSYYHFLETKTSKKKILKTVLDFIIISLINDFWKLEQNQLRVQKCFKSKKKYFFKIEIEISFFSQFSMELILGEQLASSFL